MSEQSRRGARFVTSVVAVMACALATRSAPAQSIDGAAPVLVIAVGLRGDPDDFGAPVSMRVAAAVGPDAGVGPSAARQLAERHGARPLAGDPLAPLRERALAARRGWVQAQSAGDEPVMNATMATLESTAHELEAAPAQLDNPANLDSLRRALIFIAEHNHDANGSAIHAEDAVHRFARIDPAYAFQARDASPEVQHEYARAVAALPRGALSVESTEPGCMVFRNGQPMGAAPVELQNLPVASHRISLACGALQSLVHTVNVSANTRATVRIDPQIDAALTTHPLALLRYESAAQAHERLPRHLTLLGRAYGARRVFAVLAHEDTVTVVDVATGAEVGQSPVTDGSRLRLLVTQPVTAARPEPAQANAAATVAPPVVVVVAAPHRGGAPVGAIVLGTLGLGFVGAGIYAHFRGEDALHRLRQNGSGEHDSVETWRSVQNEIEALRWIELGGYALGGVAVVAAVLLGVLGGDADEPAPRVRAGVMPLPGGGIFTLAGSL